MDNDQETEPPCWESYARFTLIDGKPVTWEEISGDQQKLIDKLEPGQCVFGIEITIPHPKKGCILP